MIGELIDSKYRIRRELGAGGMGAVYEAEHTGTGRRVAVKVVNADLAKHAGIVQRFHREARAAGAIETQHIVQILDSGTDPGRSMPYLVMELLRGEDLQALVRRLGPLPPDLALRLVGHACRGLSKAHEAGVVHRDIKPANLYLSRREDGEVIVKLVDFGIAKTWIGPTGTVEAGLTATGSMLGSPRYMSPEQAVALKTIDHRTDIWSVGAVLYELLTGRSAYAHCDSVGMMIMVICTQDPAPIQDAAPWVPPEVASIVHRAMTRDVNARFQTASTMLEAISRLIPQGLAIREDLLVPLSPEQRGVAAPRDTQASATVESLLAQVTVAHPPPSTKEIVATRPLAPARELAGDDGSAPQPPGPAAVASSLAAAPRQRTPAGRPPLALLAAGGVFVLAGAGVVAFRFGRGAAPDTSRDTTAAIEASGHPIASAGTGDPPAALASARGEASVSSPKAEAARSTSPMNKPGSSPSKAPATSTASAARSAPAPVSASAKPVEAPAPPNKPPDEGATRFE